MADMCKDALQRHGRQQLRLPSQLRKADTTNDMRRRLRCTYRRKTFNSWLGANGYSAMQAPMFRGMHSAKLGKCKKMQDVK